MQTPKWKKKEKELREAKGRRKDVKKKRIELLLALKKKGC